MGKNKFIIKQFLDINRHVKIKNNKLLITHAYSDIPWMPDHLQALTATAARAWRRLRFREYQRCSFCSWNFFIWIYQRSCHCLYSQRVKFGRKVLNRFWNWASIATLWIVWWERCSEPLSLSVHVTVCKETKKNHLSTGQPCFEKHLSWGHLHLSWLNVHGVIFLSNIDWCL